MPALLMSCSLSVAPLTGFKWQDYHKTSIKIIVTNIKFFDDFLTNPASILISDFQRNSEKN